MPANSTEQCSGDRTVRISVAAELHGASDSLFEAGRVTQLPESVWNATGTQPMLRV